MMAKQRSPSWVDAFAREKEMRAKYAIDRRVAGISAAKALYPGLPSEVGDEAPVRAKPYSREDDYERIRDMWRPAGSRRIKRSK